jgi:hypothetical protein
MGYGMWDVGDFQGTVLKGWLHVVHWKLWHFNAQSGVCGVDLPSRALFFAGKLIASTHSEDLKNMPT